MTLSIAARAILVTGIAAIAIPVLAAESTSSATSTSSTTSSSSSTSKNEKVIEEVLVTAQKRTESVLDVPMSINVVSGNMLDEYRMEEMRYIDDLVPNLRVSATAASDGISMRGVGSSAGNLGAEQSVSMFVDGIYGGRSHQWQNPLYDVERVEVLRGPQGALVGKNTLAGAVNVLTRRPTDQFEAEIRGGYEFEMDGVELNGLVSGPISEKFYGRIAAQYQDTDGWIKNPYSGRDEPQVKNWLIRTSGVYDGETVHGFAKLEYSSVKMDGCIWDTFAPTESNKPTFVNGCNGWVPENWLEFDDTDSWNFAMDVDFDIGELTLTSITGYSYYDTGKLTDSDFGEFDNLAAQFYENYNQFSQEFRLLSPGGKKFDWVTGVYYHTWDLNTDRISMYNNLFGVINGTISRKGDQKDWVISPYAQANWNITDKLKVSGSIRYTHEDKDGCITRDRTGNAPGLLTDFCQNRKEDHWDPAGSIQYFMTNQIMFFFTYGEGSKGGGFTVDSTAVTEADFQYEDEGAKTYELGVKYENNYARIQLTGYKTDFTNQQVSIYDQQSLVFVSQNVGKSRSKGFELEALVQPWPSFSVGASVAYLDAYYTYWPDGRCLWPNDTDSSCREDRSGTPFDTPKWGASGTANYSHSLTSTMNFSAGLILTYQSDDNRFVDPRCRLDAYTKVHGRVGLEGSDGRWAANLSGRNLTNEKTFQGCVPTPLLPGWLTYNTEPTRQVTLELTYRFR